jgi:hypothetical protein
VRGIPKESSRFHNGQGKRALDCWRLSASSSRAGCCHR